MNEDKRKKTSTYFGIIIFAILIFLGLIILSSGIFNISGVNISGNLQVKSDLISSSSGISVGKNIFLCNTEDAVKQLEKLPYIKTAQVKKSYPNKIYISIVERKAYAYVKQKDMGSYLLIDSSGLVLDTEQTVSKKLPVVMDLDYSSFTLGQVIETADNQSFQDVVVLSQLIQKYKIDGTVKMEVSDKMNLLLNVDGVDVSVGDISDMDYKIRTMQQCLIGLKQKMPNTQGFLDVSDINASPIFKPLR